MTSAVLDSPTPSMPSPTVRSRPLTALHWAILSVLGCGVLWWTQAAAAATKPRRTEAEASAQERSPGNPLPRRGFDRGRPLRGRVVPESPLPSDESLEIVVEAWSPPEGEFTHLQLIFATIDDSRIWQEVARVTPAADGSFKAPRPTGVTSIRLRVEGDYAYGDVMEFRAHGGRDPGTNPVVLPVSVGAHVTLECDLDEIASANEIASLEGDTLTLHGTPPQPPATDVRDILQYVHSPPAIVRGRVGTDGRVVLRGLNPLNWYAPHISGDSSHQPLAPFRIQSWPGFRPTAGKRITIPVPMERGQLLEGYVRDETGAPIEGVRVAVSGRSSAMRRSGDDGYFLFQALPKDLRYFRADASGFVDCTHDQEALAALMESASPLDVVLSRARKLDVQITTPGGSPAVGLRVTMTPHDATAPRTARTNDKGIATFDTLTRQGHSLQAVGLARHGQASKTLGLVAPFFDVEPQETGLVDATDHPNESTWAVSAEAPAGVIDSGKRLALELRRVPAIHGRLIDGESWIRSQRPAVWIYAEGARDGAIQQLLNGTADAQRSLSIPNDPLFPQRSEFHGTQLPPGSYGAIATIERMGHRLETEDSPRLRISEAIPFEVRTEPIDLALWFGPSFKLGGIVRLPSGAPLVDVEVQLSRRFGKDSLRRYAAAKTDHEGRYVFNDLDRGTYWIRVQPSRFSMERAVQVVLEEGLPIGDVELVAKGLGAVRVEPTNAEGEAIPQADTLIRHPGGELASFSIIKDDRDWAGAHGPLVPGTYVAVWEERLSADSVRCFRERVVVEAGQVTEVRFGQPASSASIVTGQVTSNGQPIPGIKVWVSDPLGVAALGMTDAEGRFVLHCMTLGPATLGAGGAPFEPVVECSIQISAGPNDAPTLILPSGVIEGMPVRGTGSAAFYRVAVSRPGDAPSDPPFRESLMDPNGTFKIPFLPDGQYEVHALEPGGMRSAEWAPQTVQIQNGEHVRGVKLEKRH